MDEEKTNFKGVPEKFSPDVRSKVMRAIKDGKIKIRSPFVFLAEKLGLESAVAAFVIFGIFFAGAIFYFLKKTGMLEFLSFGYPGLKVFLFHLPYDYIALFTFSIMLAVFFANKLEIFSGKCFRTRSFCVYFFLIALTLGIFFGSIETEDFLKKWIRNRLPTDIDTLKEEVRKDIEKQEP